MRLHRRIHSAIVVLLALVTTSHAQGTSPKRTMIDPFQVSLETLDHELSSQERLLVRSQVEQVLSNYLMKVYPWPSTTSVVFVAVARVLSYASIVGNDGAVIGARLTFDGLVYFSDTSVDIPSSSELHPIVAEALNPDTLMAALQQQFPTVSTAAIEQSLTPWPTESPTIPNSLTTPTSMPTNYPTLSPTSTPTPARKPSTMSLTASPTLPPTVEELPPTSEPTRATPSPTTPSPTTPSPTTPSPTTPSPTLMTAVPTTRIPTASPTVSPVVSPTLSPTASPTISPTPGATESNGDELVANKNSNPATVAGAVTASFLLLLILVVLVARRRKARDDSDPETADDILNDLKEYEARTEPVPSHTFSPSSGAPPEQEYDEERSPKGGGFLKYLGGMSPGRGDEDPPHLAMTDGSEAGESDASELRSEGELTSLTELYRGWWPRPSTAAASAASVSSSGASAMVNSVESFEHRKVDNHMIRKDILESPDLSAATLSQYKTGEALRASLVNEEEYDCALAPTDISAASLALKPRDEEDGGGEGGVEQVLTPRARSNFSVDSSSDSRNNGVHGRDVEGDMLSSGFSALFASWWGTSKTNRQGSLLGGGGGVTTDDDASTFGGQGDWDPDDETRTSDEQSLPSKVDSEEQSSLLDTTKNATYQMQRLRTPPEGPETRPKPITSPAGPKEMTPTKLTMTMKSPPRTPSNSRSPGSPHPILHYEAGDTTEDIYDL